MLIVYVKCPKHPRYKGLKDSKCKQCHYLFETRKNIDELPPLKPYFKVTLINEKTVLTCRRDFYPSVGISPRIVAGYRA